MNPHFEQSTRRAFLGSAAIAGLSLSTNGLSAAAGKSKRNPICVFNKPIQHLGYKEQAELVAELGFDGIEGTVRKGGHVEPDNVEKDLPRQIKALREQGLEMTIMTTDVDSADSEIHRRVLETAASLGVKRFRMGGIKYADDKPIPAQLATIKEEFANLAAFCAPLDLQPLYQIHSGAYRFGAGIWDLHSVLEQIENGNPGVAYDIRHATVEGGLSWPTEFDLMRPYFGAVYCKDFVWDESKGRPENVPLGTGQVDYPRFFSMLKKSGFDGPISLHMEYMDHRDPTLLQKAIAAIKQDRETLLELLQG